jgi:hypothetical protein
MVHEWIMTHTNSLQDSSKKSSLSSYKISYNSHGDYIKVVIFLGTPKSNIPCVQFFWNIIIPSNEIYKSNALTIFWLALGIWTFYHCIKFLIRLDLNPYKMGNTTSFNNKDGHYGEDWKNIAKLVWLIFPWVEKNPRIPWTSWPTRNKWGGHIISNVRTKWILMLVLIKWILSEYHTLVFKMSKMQTQSSYWC